MLQTLPTIAPITGKHFIAAIAGQRDRDILSRHGANLQRRHRRIVAKGLVIDRRQAAYQADRVRIRRLQVVISVVAPGHLGGVGRFIPPLGVEAHGKGADIVVIQPRHHRHDAAGIDAA